jgi:hypothetical protein
VQKDSEDPDTDAARKSLSPEQATGNAAGRACAKSEESGRQIERASQSAAHEDGAKQVVSLGNCWECGSGHLGPLQTKFSGQQVAN